uniref:Na/Pi cotransporter family protein n=1 Tax=uncultured Draconibacterium sp. TaxID=1573823 RepID=UPI003216C216
MNWWTFTILLLGGLGIFLHGMNVMTEGLKNAAGTRMKLFLKSMTRNRWTSLLAGTGVTAVIQSSSVTTVLAVGFVSAGLLSFQSTLGLILGANLGTTITAQIIAFKITKASWVMVAFGYLFSVVFANKSYKDIGTIILGLGLVFLGMNVMSEATSPLKTYQPFIELMEGLDNYLWGILIGTVFTALVQSSSATTGVVIVLASQGLISVEAGIALVYGANIGTCVTAVLSALGKPRAAMRVAISHVLFKVAGVLLWYFFTDQLAALVRLISESNEARQIANAHTIFNVGNTLLFIWLVNPVSKLVLKILPEKKDTRRQFPELHSYFLENTSMALDLANSSIFKLGEESLKLIRNGLNVALTGNAVQLLELRKNDTVIDRGHKEILIFLQQIQSRSISKKETKRLEQDIEAVNVLEAAADLITTNLVEAAEHRIEKGFEASEDTIEQLSSLYMVAFDSISTGLKRYGGQETEKGEQLSKSEFKDQFLKVRSHLIHRLAEPDEMRISIFRFESEILEVIRHLHALARRLERKA